MKRINIKKTGLLMLAMLLSAGGLLAQERRIVLPGTRVETARVIEAVERQTGLTFSYNSRLLNAAAPAVFSDTTLSLEQVLDQMLSGKGLAHLLRGEYIIIHPDFKKRAPQPKVSDGYVPTPLDAHSADPMPRPAAVAPEPAKPVVRLVPAPAPDTTKYYSDHRPLGRFLREGHLPTLVVKTNLLYGAGTLTPNLALEVGIANRWTVALSGSYNPWNRVGTLANNDKLVHFVVRPEVRYWFCERFVGHSLSVSPFYNQFNVGGYDIPFVGFEKKYRYEGYAVGAGINYGYSMPLARRWNLEFSAGAGVAVMSYDTYDCTLCSGRLDVHKKTYFGPTHLGINIVYLIR